MLGADDEVAQPRPRRDVDHEIVLAGVHLLALQLLVALHAGLALGVASARIRLNPLELVLDELLATLLGLRLAGEHRLLLLEPLLVVPLVGVADAVVELEDPVRHVAQEVAVVRDDDERALEVLEIGLEAERRLGVEVVRRFVEQQHVRFLQEEAGDRHAAALAAGEHLHGLVGRRATHVGHRHLDLVVDVPEVLRVDDLLEALHLLRLLGIVELAAEILVAFHHRLCLGNALLDDLADRLGVIELGLLRKVANLGSLRHLAGSEDVRVDPRENLEERALARAITTDHADVRAVEEAQAHIFQNRLRALLLRHVNQGKLVFTRHINPLTNLQIRQSNNQEITSVQPAPGRPSHRQPYGRSTP